MTQGLKYKSRLKYRAEEFIEKLQQEGFSADISMDSYREYSVKISVTGHGFVSLFYSPSKDGYKITVNELYPNETAHKILKIWNPDYRDVNSVYSGRGIEIDVDGSFMNGITSYGAVIRKNGKVVGKLSGILDKTEVKGSHQIAGEIRAVRESVNWCINNNVSNATVYYDYAGLEKWAKGTWKTKKNLTSEYENFMKNIPLKINWVKIESHTGAEWNELADKLAKKEIQNAGKEK